ncbi:hypothetical protein ACIQM4_23870 [Streptomyces sp. NPDC091272]|uniref:hypothetical protein n=1 Tax=Streptomyces sp. NPDC091272 TaxID=3365981 RepID=UPI0037F61826
MALHKAAALALSTSLCGALILGTAGAAVAAVDPGDHTPAVSAPTAQQREAARDLDELLEDVRGLDELAEAARTMFDDDDADDVPAGRHQARTQVEAKLAAALGRPAAAERDAAPKPDPAAGRGQGAAEPKPDAGKARTELKAQLKNLVEALVTGDWKKTRQSLSSVTKLSGALMSRTTVSRTATWTRF